MIAKYTGYKLALILVLILIFGCLETLVISVIPGAICAGIISGLLCRYLYKNSDKKKKFLMYLIFMLAAEVGVIIAVLLIDQAIDLSLQLSLITILIPPKSHCAGYFLIDVVTKIKRGVH